MARVDERILCFTVDLEECTLPQEFGGRSLSERVSIELSAQGTYRLLDVLESAKVKATFFTTGFFASKCPELVKRIIYLGNEIANHGLKHYPSNTGTFSERLRNLRESGNIIKRVSGKQPLGYREPRLDMKQDTIEILARLNYLYDSSILPTLIPRRHNRLMMRYTPFQWDCKGLGRLIEIPISVTPLFRLPVGWWWFRKNFGHQICEKGFEALWRRNLPVVCNLHPWELIELPDMPYVPMHVRYGCGVKSNTQVREIIDFGKKANARFVTMIDIAERFSTLTWKDHGSYS